MNLVLLNNLSSPALETLLDEAKTSVLFISDPRVTIEPGPRLFDRMRQVLEETGAAWVYSDSISHPRIDYQPGSIRDTFDFGPVVAISLSAARQAGLTPGLQWGALYDLRLRMSELTLPLRIPEPLYAESRTNARTPEQAMFDYVDPRNREYQLEMEKIATEHLQRIGAFLKPVFRVPETGPASFPVKASVIIPVRNRERTILDAVTSALSQKTPFPFNVIVVNNHSTDGTTSLLKSVEDPRLIHMIPDRLDLGIGGCWNLAVSSSSCGQYSVQLDSDDLYQDETVLPRIVNELESGPYAMAVGSYTMVNFSLEEIPPGLIDHREWSRKNGGNNALRVNGLGAPRAFATAILRQIGFPNVSYGEDYAVALRMSREYEIGRIYDSVYLCRRWEGNSDSALPLETQNRYDAYKDWIRTVEIAARKRILG